jgi:hypothetical protein
MKQVGLRKFCNVPDEELEGPSEILLLQKPRPSEESNMTLQYHRIVTYKIQVRQRVTKITE